MEANGEIELINRVVTPGKRTGIYFWTYFATFHLVATQCVLLFISYQKESCQCLLILYNFICRISAIGLNCETSGKYQKTSVWMPFWEVNVKYQKYVDCDPTRIKKRLTIVHSQNLAELLSYGQTYFQGLGKFTFGLYASV